MVIGGEETRGGGSKMEPGGARNRESKQRSEPVERRGRKKSVVLAKGEG